MTREDTLKNFNEKFKEHILGSYDKSPKRAYVDIRPEGLVPMAKYLFEERKARFNIASGLDARDHMEILYHFSFDEWDVVMTLRVKLEKAKLEIDSLAPLFKGANWIEREIHEMLGINFKGHPNLERLLLPDEWPQGVYPLRRDYQEWDKDAIRDRGVPDA